MENSGNTEKKSFLKNKAFILIYIGVAARIFMLIYYYYTHLLDPQRPWGDVSINYYGLWAGYTILTLGLLIIFQQLSFGFIEIFAFWAFIWDLLICLLFYLVLKSFNIKNKNYAFGLFMINPFFFLNNSFSLTNCGYHITDSFFFFFLLIAFIYYPKKELYARYLFYIFLGLSMCAKYYTLPALGLLFIKFFYEKDWSEMKICMISIIPLLILLLVIPLIFIEAYLPKLIWWHQPGSYIPLYIRIIPIVSIILLFILFRLKKSDPIEISIISIIALGSFMIFSWPYLRWFQSFIFLGILKEKEFYTFNLKKGFNKTTEIEVDNHILTFVLSVLASALSIIFIIFIL